MEDLQNTLTLQDKGSALMVCLRGEITLEVTGDIRKRTEAAMGERDYTCVVMDLSQVPFIDSSGIGLLVALNTMTQNAGRRMLLFTPSEQVRKTLELVQLLSFFTLVEDEDELLTILH